MTKATSRGGAAPTLDDYNPFDASQAKTSNKGGDAGAAVVPTEAAPATQGGNGNAPAQPPPYAQTAAQQQATTADFQVTVKI